MWPVSPASARAPVSASPRGALVALACALAAVSLLGVVRNVRSLDAAERSVASSDLTTAGWRTTPHRLGRFPMRPGDVMRVTACAAGGGDPRVRVEARSPDGRVSFGRPLTASLSDARRCVGFRWTAPSNVALDVALTGGGAPLRRLSLHAGPPLRASSAWPLAALLVSIALLVLAPSLTAEPPRPPPSSRADIFRPVADRPGAFVALFASLAACSFLLPLAVLSLLPPSPVASLSALLAQNAGFCLAAAWMLGGLDPDGPPLREALGLGRASPRWLSTAAPLAGALVAFAVVTSRWLTDTSESPVARELASTPRALVLLYTALLAPLSEELFYRGAALRVMRGAGPAVAVILQSLVFTALHAPQLRGSPAGLGPIAAVALVNGWLRVTSGGLAAPWLVHALYNGALIAAALSAAS